MPIVGPDIALTIREKHPQVFLTLVEEMSHVLVNTLSRGELDFILCYDVPDLPHLTRLALLSDDLVLVALPSGTMGRPIPFAEALEESLAMPEEGDMVRKAVSRTARELGLELRIAHEMRSITAMKGLALRGVAASILPFASVIDEVRAGKLDARPIVMPTVSRTLFVASLAQRRPFRYETGLIGAVRSSLTNLTDALGALAHPLWTRST